MTSEVSKELKNKLKVKIETGATQDTQPSVNQISTDNVYFFLFTQVVLMLS